MVTKKHQASQTKRGFLFAKFAFLNQIRYYIKVTKKEFLLEHNNLSPLNLQATLFLLTCFKAEKMSLFKKDKSWSIDKLRKPFIMWITSLTKKEKRDINKQEKALIK